MNLRSLCLCLAALAALNSSAYADSFNITSGAVQSTTVGPSADTISLDAGSATISDFGTVNFQTGNILIGNSPIPAQIINFSLLDSITINGITRDVTIFGQDNVTDSVDVISIFASTPVTFGGEVFAINPANYTGLAVGQSIPITLSGTVTPTPEPATLSMLALGLAGGVVLLVRSAGSANLV